MKSRTTTDETRTINPAAAGRALASPFSVTSAFDPGSGASKSRIGVADGMWS
jgi:hypothetical protein